MPYDLLKKWFQKYCAFKQFAKVFSLLILLLSDVGRLSAQTLAYIKCNAISSKSDDFYNGFLNNILENTQKKMSAM